MLLISTLKQAALSVLGLQRGGLPRFTRALSRFVTVALTSGYPYRFTSITLLYAVWTFLSVLYGTPRSSFFL